MKSGAPLFRHLRRWEQPPERRVSVLLHGDAAATTTQRNPPEFARY
ncbi:hypothetical protein BCGT_3731 [Mycobacterium tuberculosis variant bovis BCG str. ATCC 35743]|nr:hypothetical protein BCGT_3731 [Mycobacterium tuberculosis variant bovis BCG str. ATCC 35743]ALA80541.1 Uncharacterized protein BCGR_4226 [Mycobacterium tuberculosis variant bovis BCG]